MPEEEIEPEHPGRSTGSSTGPTSPQGKEISSQNALKHGCCSNRLILADESEQEWRDLLQGWLDDYQPGTQTGRSLVAKAAEAEWFLLRMIRRQKEAEQRLTAEQPDLFLWTGEQHKLLERFLRYRTTAERSFTRALNNLERLRKNRIQEADREERRAQRLQKAEAAATAKAAKAKPEPELEEQQCVFCAQNSEKKQRKIHTLKPWLEVTDEDGRTVTTFRPPKERGECECPVCVENTRILAQESECPDPNRPFTFES